MGITGGWYSLRSARPALRKGQNRKDGGRLLAPSGEIEYGANFSRDTAIDSLPPSLGFILFRTPLFRRAVRSAQTNALFSRRFR